VLSRLNTDCETIALISVNSSEQQNARPLNRVPMHAVADRKFYYGQQPKFVSLPAANCDEEIRLENAICTP
jgi:hypothetical protein